MAPPATNRAPSRPLVRPWALAGPIAILLFCLPLLRPLRHAQPAEDESMRLATVEALLDHGTLALSPDTFDDPSQSPSLLRVNDHLYADQAPTFAVLLAGPAWVIRKLGWNLQTDPAVVAYALTLIGVTIPVAGTAGLLYRMARLFELNRRWRSALSIAVIAGSGLLSYAVVLNAQAPAACLLVAAAACLIHVETCKRPRRSAGWLAIAGTLAALAVSFDITAGLVALPLVFVIIATRFSIRFRVGGVLLYLLGTLPVLAVHSAFTRPITGDLLPPSFHRELSARPIASRTASPEPEEDADDIISRPGLLLSFTRTCDWLTTALVGAHGLLSHFPILILGVGGVGAVMHRHWPTPVKVLAASSLAGATGAMVIFCWTHRDFQDAMFGIRWMVPLLPLLLFWLGAWARRSHGRFAWATAGALLSFSVIVSLIGATYPVPREGYNDYSAGEAMTRLFNPGKPAPDVVAGR